MISIVAPVARRLALAALVLAPLTSVACSAPSSAEEVESADFFFNDTATTETWRYAGSFRVKDADYGLEISISVPRSSVSTQTLQSAKSIGTSWYHYCQAYTESPKAKIRTRVLDASGTVVADTTSNDNFNVSTRLDRDVACPTGHLVSANAIASLQGELLTDGLEPITLQGTKVSIPFGYGGRGTYAFHAAASYRATSAVVVKNESLDYENRTEGSVASGILTLAAPQDLTVNVGIPGSSTRFPELAFAEVHLRRQ